VKHPTNSHQGCFESHVKVAQDAHKKGYKRILIFEDDIYINEKGLKNMDKAIRFMKKRKWDLFLFGIFQNIFNYSNIKISKHIYKLKKRSWTCLHSYAVNDSAIKIIKDYTWENWKLPVDIVYSTELITYSLYPSIFKQSGSKSDIAPLKYLIPFGIFKWIFQIVEWYSYHINVPLTYVIIAVILVTILVLFYK